ncbi:MAG: PAS domain S-box protein [Nitrospinae bacterium]|nr:PAS domain S-box protein [Nitrospinota bacterium]MBL7021032.1 PAS domain S-box protein [Nitrospinaceae bacterium]
MDEEQKISSLTAQVNALKEELVLLKKASTAESFLVSIIENTDDAVIGKDLAGKIISWNTGAENIYGYSSQEILGQNITLLIPQDLRHERDEFLMQVKQGQKINHRQTTRIKKDGSLFNVSLTISPIKDASGNIIGASTIARDISLSKTIETELQGERARTQAILDNVVDGIITIDEVGSIQSFNSASERIFGYSTNEVLGKNVKTLMPEPYHSEHDGYLGNYLSSGIAKIIGIGREVVGLRKDKSTFPLELAISEVHVEGQRLFTGIVRDISERKAFEVALKKSTEEAESANQAKSIFLANMSHEIRTPMNAILGFSQILLRNNDLDDDTKVSVNAINSSGQNLLTLINEILDISKIEAGKMELILDSFDLQALIKDVTAMFSLRCEEKQLQLHINNLSNSVIVFGDVGKLRQILINLLGNAVKFTNSGEVSITVTPLDDDRFQFDLKDTGIGIPPEAQQHIFEPFHQDEGGNKMGGTGLGLTICQRQLELMDSKLTLKSALNQGAQFSFILNLPAGEKSDVMEDRHTQRKVLHLAPGLCVKALVVDDVEVNRNVLAKLLTHIGVDVILAENGEEAIQKVKESLPDIIFMDMRMPVLNGEKATRKIQEEYGKDRFKIVAITASALEHRREFYLNLGFHEFIAKPFKEDEIFYSLEKLLDIKFTYPDESSEPENSKGFEVSDITLPEALLSEMKNAAELHQITTLEKFIEEITSLGGGAEKLAAHLKPLLKKYDMNGILDILNKINKSLV